VRIAFYAPMKAPSHPTPSGERQMARLLWAALEKAGHEVRLASSFRSYDASGCASRQRRLAAIGSRLAGRMLARCRSRPAAQRPEMWFTYHLYHKAPDWLGPAVSRALGIPYVVAEASSAPKQAQGAWAEGYAAANRAIAAADRVIILNPSDRPCLGPLVATPHRLVSLPPFIDAAPFLRAGADRARHRRELAQRLGLDRNGGNEPVLLTVAMMRPGDKLSSYRVLGQALKRIADRTWTLVIAGDGAARADVAQALAPIEGRVAWLGLIEQHALPAVYAAADLYLWPAINEAYGLAFLEAQAAGLAVVAGRCGGVPAVVGDGEAGYLAPVGDAEAFAGAVARLLDDSPHRRAMARRAASRIAARHDLAPASAALTALVNALGRAGAPA
jgi:glycosyltransferase involved in cell wall biosynthesis